LSYILVADGLAEITARIATLETNAHVKTGVGPSTNAEFYDSVHPKVKQFVQRASQSAQLSLTSDFTLIEAYENAKIATATTANAQFLPNESNIVQPIWSSYLGVGGLNVGTGSILKFSSHKTFFGKPITLDWEDTHKAPSIGTRKPDECLYIKDKPHTAFYVAVVGDLKDPGEKFKADAKGHILAFMLRLMEFQPSRPYVIGYLRNSNVIQFFRVCRDAGASHDAVTFTYLETQEYSWAKEGAQLFASILTSKPGELGWEVPKLPWKGMEVTAFLGAGASCSVYATNEETVVKVFKRVPELEAEENNLKSLGACAAFVPQVLKTKDCFMEVSPIGKHFTDDLVKAASNPIIKALPEHAVFGLKHMLQLVDVVKASPLVHRDLHPGNIFVKDNDDLLVNDWGLAITPGTVNQFVGVEQYVSPSILAAKQSGAAYAAKFEDDLCAIVRIAYRLLHAHDFKRVTVETPANFWASRLSSGQWSMAEAAATEGEHESLKAALTELMPW
jgi:hypothetical protein